MGKDIKPQAGAQFDPGKSYVVRGDLLNRLAAAALPVSAGRGLKEFQTAKGKVISLATEAPYIPFEPQLIANGETYSATVGEGLIIEHDASAGVGADALRYHRATNHRDANNVLVKFALTVGQGVYVSVAETPTGKIDTTVPIVLSVKPVTTKSLNFIPGLQDGVTHYLIAELKNVGGQIKLVPTCGGSNIFYESGLTADLVLRSCPFFEPGAEEATPGAILLRGSFTRGKLAVVGASVEDRPFAEIKQESSIDAEPCT